MVRKSSEGFSHDHRIVLGSGFRSIYSVGKRFHSESFVLFGRENDLGHHRLGITVPRKVGNAVVRNRIKRLFREVFRKSAAEIPHHFDLVVNAKRNCALATYESLREEFLSGVRKLCS